MFERFTNRARHAVVLAQEESRRLHHNYIGTEHVLLGLLGEPDGLAGRALTGLGVTLEGTRERVAAIVGTGTAEPAGHIPFTPRAKKVLELSLREALRLGHNYIGTEHILLGLIREGDGVAAQVLAELCGLPAARKAVLDLVATLPDRPSRWRFRPPWARGGPLRGMPVGFGGTGFETFGYAGEAGPAVEPRTTGAAEATVEEARRLAGDDPIGSQHLLLAALGDPGSATVKALGQLGVDIEQLRRALREVDVGGTTDELPEEAGRRQMLLRLTDGRLSLETTDPVLLDGARAALDRLGDPARGSGVISGDLPVSVGLADVWEALHGALQDIERRAGIAGSA